VSVGGRTRWISFHARQLAGTSPVRVLVTAWDTTALVESRWIAEAAAEEAMGHAAALEAVISAIADGLIVLDVNGAVLRMNDAARALARRMGVDPEALDAGALSRLEVRTPEGLLLPVGRMPFSRALGGETVQSEHLRVGVPGATAVWVLVSAAPTRAADGRVTGAVLNLSDETALHALEEARDDLVRMVSHDLRTPLNAVFAQAHLLQRAPDSPDKVRDRARSIERSCQRMTSMIQDLVEATLLESGQLPLSRSPVDLGALLPEVLERLRGALPVERVHLAVDEGCCLAELDVARIERILVNLVSNALKYSAHEVEVRVTAGPLQTVVVSVTDRGVGISPEDQRRIFDRFYRASGSRRPEGLGLGLYIARLLAEAHGGRVEVESQLGQGSTFRLVLPGVERAEARPSPPA
jgi:signal transduction histidine kinase